MGGGRYDKLLESFSDKDKRSTVPAVGFGFGDAVIVELLGNRGLLPELPETVQVVVAPYDANLAPIAAKVGS